MFAKNALTACLCCLAYCLPIQAQMFTGNLNVVTGSSSLAVSGNLSSILGTVAYTQQGAGSLTTSYTGTMNVTIDLGANTIQFFNTTALSANNSGSWAPLPGGAPGNAAANYGVLIPNYPVAGNILAALRSVTASVTSGALPLTGGGASRSFTPTQVFSMTGGALDYNSSAGIGTSSVAGNNGNNVAPPPGTMTILGGDQFQVSFPVDMTFQIVFVASGLTITATNRLQGTLVGTGTLIAVPEPTTYALIGLTLGAAGFLTYRHRNRRKKWLNQQI